MKNFKNLRKPSINWFSEIKSTSKYPSKKMVQLNKIYPVGEPLFDAFRPLPWGRARSSRFLSILWWRRSRPAGDPRTWSRPTEASCRTERCDLASWKITIKFFNFQSNKTSLVSPVKVILRFSDIDQKVVGWPSGSKVKKCQNGHLKTITWFLIFKQSFYDSKLQVLIFFKY